MKNNKIFIFISVFFISVSLHSQGVVLENKEYAVDTLLFQKQIGPGVLHSSYRIPAYPLEFQVMEIDLTNPYIQIETCKAGDKGVAVEQPTRMGARKDKPGHEVVGGTNGDFYFYQDPVETGIPRSGQFLNGEMIANPTGRASFLLDSNKKPYIDRVNYSSSLISGTDTIRIHTVNMQRLEWEPAAGDFLTLYTDKYGTTTSGIGGGTKVVIRPKLGDRFSIGANDTIVCVVESVTVNSGESTIPEGKAVLHGRDGASDLLKGLSVGAEVTMAFNTRLRSNPTLSLDFKELVGGSNTIVLRDGNPQNEGSAETKEPRTAMGVSKDKSKVYMVVVDGRSGKSVGISYTPFGQLFKAIGAWDAVNLDGGGSSVMFVNKQKIVNSPSGGVERAVGNSVLVVSSAPTDSEVGIIKPYKATISLPKYGEHTPQFYGYNQYETLLDSDLEGVVLSCPESLGMIIGNKFIATGDKPGNITATYNGKVVTTIAVNFVPVTDIKIRLDSAIVDNRTDYPIEVIGVTATSESAISPIALTWTVEDPTICEVVNGAVKALKNGSTKITGKINDVVDEILIHIEIPASSTMIGDSMFVSDWDMKISSFMKEVDFSNTNIPSHWEYGSAVNFKSSTGRAPYITLSNATSFYGLPDTIKFVMNIGDMAVDNAIFTFNANDSQKSTITLTSFEANKDFSLAIPVDQLFDANDKGIYPIWFDNVKFNIKASGMTAGQTYSLGVKEITLCYKDVVSSSVGSIRTDFFQVYPNPVNKGQDIYVSMKESETQEAFVEIYDLTGQKIKSYSHTSFRNSMITIPLNNISSGTYLLKVYNGQDLGVKKIIIK